MAFQVFVSKREAKKVKMFNPEYDRVNILRIDALRRIGSGDFSRSAIFDAFEWATTDDNDKWVRHNEGEYTLTEVDKEWLKGLAEYYADLEQGEFDRLGY